MVDITFKINTHRSAVAQAVVEVGTASQAKFAE